eukprot:349473-Pleurochrysis_carterae.AAC.1
MQNRLRSRRGGALLSMALCLTRVLGLIAAPHRVAREGKRAHGERVAGQLRNELLRRRRKARGEAHAPLTSLEKKRSVSKKPKGVAGFKPKESTRWPDGMVFTR